MLSGTFISENSQTQMTFSAGEVSFKTEVCVSTSTPELTMSWINEVEMAGSTDDLTTSHTVEGQFFLDFEMLDARSACGLRKSNELRNTTGS